MTTISISIWSYLKHMLFQLLNFESPSLNGKSLNGFQSTDLLSPKEEKAITTELKKLNIEVPSNQNSNPAPDNKTAKWITNKVARDFDPLKFKGFVHGYFPGFRIREFIEPTEAKKIADAIVGFVEEYKTAPGVGRAGITAVEFPHDFGEYAEIGAILRDPNISIPYRLELADKIIMHLTRNTGYQYKPLHKDGIEMFWGLFREINTGAGWHLDNVTKDMDVFNNRKSIFQGSAVLHIKTPAKGGETIMANRKAQEGDQQFFNPDGWTYDGKMLDGILKSEVPAIAGDLVFLSTLNYHTVNPCLEVGAERISFSMFFVIFEDEPNVIYYYN